MEPTVTTAEPPTFPRNVVVALPMLMILAVAPVAVTSARIVVLLLAFSANRPLPLRVTFGYQTVPATGVAAVVLRSLARMPSVPPEPP